jgi:hypothetical protein
MEKHPETGAKGMKWLMGENSAVINEIKPAKEIVDEMVSTAARCIQTGAADLTSGGRARL